MFELSYSKTLVPEKNAKAKRTVSASDAETLIPEKTAKDDEQTEADLPVEIQPALTENEAVAVELPMNETETLIKKEKIVKISELKGGSNKSYIVHLKDDGDAIFKPAAGERYLRKDIKQGTYFKRERAAYLIDKMLGFNLVPATEIRTVGSQIGSIQQFVPDAKSSYRILSETLKLAYEGTAAEEAEETAPAEKMGQGLPLVNIVGADDYTRVRDNVLAEIKPEMQKMWLLDYIVWNTDRHDNNYLIKDGNVVAIDHGLCFAGSSPRFASEHFEQPMSPEVLENFRKFTESEENQKLLEGALHGLLEETQISSCMARITKLADLLKNNQGQIPETLRGELTY